MLIRYNRLIVIKLRAIYEGWGMGLLTPHAFFFFSFLRMLVCRAESEHYYTSQWGDIRHTCMLDCKRKMKSPSNGAILVEKQSEVKQIKVTFSFLMTFNQGLNAKIVFKAATERHMEMSCCCKKRSIHVVQTPEKDKLRQNNIFFKSAKLCENTHHDLRTVRLGHLLQPATEEAYEEEEEKKVVPVPPCKTYSKVNQLTLLHQMCFPCMQLSSYHSNCIPEPNTHPSVIWHRLFDAPCVRART